MGMEYAPRKKKQLRQKKKREQQAGTWGGEVSVRRIGDPYVPPPLPKSRQRVGRETKPVEQ